MPGDFVTVLLAAQEGDEAGFARLYERTNPALVRYLRVVTDADPANLALTTWTTLLRRLPSCPADESSWLELVVGVARLAVEDARQREAWSHLVDPALHLPSPALADLETRSLVDGPGGPSGADEGAAAPAAPGLEPGGDPTSEVVAEAEPTDGLDRTIAALRSCPPEEADLLAMRATAWLNRAALCRLTGRDAAGVQAVLDQALEHVGLPLFTLVKALRTPARADEVADLPVVLQLFAATAAGRSVAVATTAASVAFLGAALEPQTVNLLDIPAAASASKAARHAGGTTVGAASRLGWVGATAAAAALALGGVGAAAWNGLLPDVFGRHGASRTPSAEGAARTGAPGGGDGEHPGRPATGQRPVTTPPPPATGGGGAATPGSGSVSLGRVELVVQVVSSADAAASPASATPPVVTRPPATASTPPPTTPGQPAPGLSSPPTSRPPASKPPATPPSSKPAPGPRLGPTRAHPKVQRGKGKGNGKGHAYAYGKGHPKHSTSQGLARGHRPGPAAARR